MLQFQGTKAALEKKCKLRKFVQDIIFLSYGELGVRKVPNLVIWYIRGDWAICISMHFMYILGWLPKVIGELYG